MSAEFSALADTFRAEEATWGRLPAAMRFKQILVKRFGLEEAHRLLRTVAPIPASKDLTERRVMPLHDAVNRNKGYRLLWAGGDEFMAPPLHVVGKSDHGNFSGVSRAAYIGCVADAMVRGRSGLITTGPDTALADRENGEFGSIPDNPEYDPAVLAGTGDQLWMMGPDQGESVTQVPEAFMLSGSHTVDFGHWMTEYLPRAAMARLAGLPPMPILVDQRIPQSLKEALNIFLPRHGPLVPLPWISPLRVARLWVAPAPMYMPFYPTDWSTRTWTAMATHGPNFARLICELTCSLPQPTTTGRRLFLARKPSQPKKRLLNHLEIEALAAKYGFDIVYTQDMTFAEQLGLIRTADYIMGPEGSALLWAIYARPGTRVCCLSSEHTYPLADVNSILSALGIGYSVITGPATGNAEDWLFWENYTINRQRVEDFLADWLQS